MPILSSISVYRNRNSEVIKRGIFNFPILDVSTVVLIFDIDLYNLKSIKKYCLKSFAYAVYCCGYARLVQQRVS